MGCRRAPSFRLDRAPYVALTRFRSRFEGLELVADLKVTSSSLVGRATDLGDASVACGRMRGQELFRTS